LRTWLEQQHIRYVLAVACDHRVPAAVLTIAASLEHARNVVQEGQIPLTRNEIAHLLSSMLIYPAHDTQHRIRWSRWRRRHQHRARTCHYQRQAAQDR
jgi:hypothetical protein